MPTEVKVPPFPESVEEGTLSAWHKQAGDTVARDEKIADIETDKIVLEVTAPEAGVLGALQVEAGATVKAGAVIATIGAAGKKGGRGAADKEENPPSAKVPAEDSADKTNASKAGREKSSDDEAQSSVTDKAGSRAEPKAADDTPPVLSPAVRRLVAEHDLDPGAIEGSGRGGRLTKGDVLVYLETRGEEAGADDDGDTAAAKMPDVRGAEPMADEWEPRPEAGDADTPVAAAAPDWDEERPEKRVPMTRIRQRIAERLVAAQQEAALLTTFNEVNMKPVMDLRARYKADFEKTYGVKLGFMSFFVKAAVAALKKFPVVNATLDDGDIVYHGYYDIGVAVSTERGLVVPVLRDVDQLSFAQIEQAILDYAGRAREGKLEMADLTGGTFTITNGGIFGSLLSTPIINPPQSGILGMHTIQDRPVAVDGQVVVRPMMYIALTYDHRLIDGRDAVQFLVEIKTVLEDPAKVLLAV